MKTILFLLLLLNGSSVFAQNQKITLSIDDLPCTHCKNLAAAKALNKKLISTINTYKVPAIGFVNENKLYTKAHVDQSKVELLRAWLENDLDLGNHTFFPYFY